MAKCNVCGKKGLFLRVNSSGRCKECEEKFRDIEQERAEQKRKEREKIEEQRIKKISYAKDMLVAIADLYTEIYRAGFETERLISENNIKAERERCEEKYSQFCKLFKKAKELELFDEILIDTISSRNKEFESRYKSLYISLIGYLDVAKRVYETNAEIFNDIMVSLWADTVLAYGRWNTNISRAENDLLRQIHETKECDCSYKDEIEVFHTDLKCGEFDILPDCVITDIETSGLVYNKNSIIEIAAIKIVNGRVVDTYSSLIRREKPLNSKVTSLTGITTDMLRNCSKSLNEVIYEYSEFIENLPLVGHNIISFDVKFINEAYLKVFGTGIKNQCIDTLKMSYECFYDNESHKLGDLAKDAGVPMGTAHRALGDCETTLYLYKYMVDSATFTFLRWSKNGKTIDETDGKYPKYLTKMYPNGMCHAYHQKIVTCGFLQKADNEEIFNTYKISELKEILSKNFLPTNGTKAVLIKRIVENINMQTLGIPDVYILSEKGLKHFDKLIDARKEEYLSNVREKDYGLARNVIHNISEIYKDIGNMKEYYFYLLCTFYHDMSGLYNGGNREDRKNLMLAPAIILELKKKSKYYEENMIERCFLQYKLPAHYFKQSEFSAILDKLFSEGITAMQEMIVGE